MSKEAGHDPFVTEAQREAAKHRLSTSHPGAIPIIQGHSDDWIEQDEGIHHGAKGTGGIEDVKRAGHGKPRVMGKRSEER